MRLRNAMIDYALAVYPLVKEHRASIRYLMDHSPFTRAQCTDLFWIARAMQDPQTRTTIRESTLGIHVLAGYLRKMKRLNLTNLQDFIDNPQEPEPRENKKRAVLRMNKNGQSHVFLHANINSAAATKLAALLADKRKKYDKALKEMNPFERDGVLLEKILLEEIDTKVEIVLPISSNQYADLCTNPEKFKAVTNTGHIVDAESYRKLLQDCELTVTRAICRAENGEVLALNSLDPQRFADEEQRKVLFLEHPVCVFKDCGRGAVNLEIDHCFVEHAKGGRTILGNLAPVCSLHHGRMYRHKTVWLEYEYASGRFYVVDKWGKREHAQGMTTNLSAAEQVRQIEKYYSGYTQNLSAH